MATPFHAIACDSKNLT